MKVTLILLLTCLAFGKQVVDPTTFEIKPSPKNIKDLFKQLDEEIVKQNATSLKKYDNSNISYRVNKEKYENLLVSLNEQKTTKTKEISGKEKELSIAKQRREALQKIKRPTKEIDSNIEEIKSIIRGKKQALKDINKRAKQTKKLVERTIKHWKKAQKKRMNDLYFFNKRVTKINRLKEIVKMAMAKNEALKLLSSDFIDAIVCGNPYERKTLYLMKNKTDKSSKELMHSLEEARDLAYKLTTPTAKTLALRKVHVKMQMQHKQRIILQKKIDKLEKKLMMASQKVDNISKECSISAGIIKRRCEKKLFKAQEKRKVIKNAIRREKANMLMLKNEIEATKTEVSADVAKRAMEISKKAREKMNVWMNTCEKQMNEARKISGKLAIEQMEGCGQYQNAVIHKREEVIDRLVVLKQRRKENYSKYISLLKKEYDAVGKNIDELSKSGDKFVKSAIIIGKYEEKGVFAGKEKSEEMKRLANQQLGKAADESDNIISQWRVLARKENKEIEKMVKEEKEIEHKIKGIQEGLIRITTNITLGLLKDELQEKKNAVAMKTQVLKTLYSLIKKMVRRSVGKNVVMRKAAVGRLVELKKAKIEMKRQIRALMKKASTVPSKQVAQIKELMKKIEKQASILVAEEMYMKQMIELCKEREKAVKRRTEKEMLIESAKKLTGKGFEISHKMQNKESKYRETEMNIKTLIRKMELVEDKDKVIIQAVISKLRKRENRLAFDLKEIEKKRRVVSGQLVEEKYKFDRLMSQRANEYRYEHGVLENLLDRIKKQEDLIVCKGSRPMYEKAIKMVKERMTVIEEEHLDFKEEVKKMIEIINMAHGKCYNGIVDGIEGDQQKCKVCIDLSQYILRQARDGKSKKRIARMILARCKASDKPHTCYSAAMSLMANYDESVINLTPLQFCVKSNKCVVREW